MFSKMKVMLVGMVIGGALVSTGSAIANTSSITAVVADWVKYKFNGTEEFLPEGYQTLIYGGRTYVPARFIAEQLGAQVDWDSKSKTVFITKPESPKVEPPKIDENQLSINFEKLPVSKMIDGVSMEIYSVNIENERTNIYLRVKNTNDIPIQLDQAETVLTADNINYKHSSVTNDGTYNIDKTWYQDIREDQTNEGYVVIPQLPEGVNKGKLYLKAFRNDGTQKSINYDFNITW